MKRVVWINKSNGQLCVTVPSGSGINEGDIVSIEKEKIEKIVYSSVTGDMFHYGHLRFLQNANRLGDIQICGIPTNEAIKSYKEEPVASLKERVAIISSLRCVDMIMVEHSKDPTDNLRKIHNQFKNAKILLAQGSDGKKVPGSEFVRKIKGEIIRLPFYEKLSPEKVVKKIFKVYKEKRIDNQG